MLQGTTAVVDYSYCKESCTSKKSKFAVIKSFQKRFMYIPHPLMGAIYGSWQSDSAAQHMDKEMTV
jgi:hypothetical protein